MSKGKGQLLEQNYYKKGHVKNKKKKKRLHGVKLVFRMFHNEKEFLLVCCHLDLSF